MPQNDNTPLGPDWGAIEQGNFPEITSALWLLYQGLQQEIQSREREIELRAPESRQDRITLMGTY